MGLEQKLSLKLSQRLVMTPTLQQAIKLLQMTRLELTDIVNEEMVANPVLEEEEPEASAASEEIASQDGGASQEEVPSMDEGGPGDSAPSGEVPQVDARNAGEPEPVVDASTEPASESFGEIDMESYFGDYMEGTAVAPRMTEEGEEFSLENRAEIPPGLADHLTEQLGVSDAAGPVREACAFLIGNVDPDGYLRMSLDEIEASVPCRHDVAEKAVALLQSFDPVGVGAKNLSECLLIQARAANIVTPLLITLITERFHELGTKAPTLLARQLGVPVEAVQKTIDWIKKLDPRPGRRYDSSRTIYVEPDVTVVKDGDEYVVLFNDDGLPRLRVSALYRRMLQTKDVALDGEGRSYLRERMRAAQWLMKSLDQRKRTIVRVAESIVKKQRDFLDYGVSQLKPLVLRDVAEDIGMHESTVSRVVSNKWIATPRGLLPMKFFFHSAIASSGGGEDVSSLAVKGKIRALIEAEDPGQPLSDARLAELLERDGIRIARRTVAKYREELHIPSSSIRKVEPEPPPAPDAPADPVQEGVEPGLPELLQVEVSEEHE